MNFRNDISALAFLLSAAAAGGITFAGVSTESPFAQRGLPAQPSVVTNNPIELRGIMSDEQGMRFAIYDPVKKEGAWVHIDDTEHSFVVRSYDAAENRIVVDYQGKSQTIVLAEPKFGAGKTIGPPIVLPGVPGQPAAPGAAQPAQGGRFAGAGAQQRAQQPTVEEARRLEDIRAEIQRRRAQREAGAQQPR